MIAPEEQQRRMDLHGKGYTDEEIAEAVGISRVAARKWRIKNGLPINAGAVNVVRCGSCVNATPDGRRMIYCGLLDVFFKKSDYCSYGTRSERDVED